MAIVAVLDQGRCSQDANVGIGPLAMTEQMQVREQVHGGIAT
jgi:hypothetical protein